MVVAEYTFRFCTIGKRIDPIKTAVYEIYTLMNRLAKFNFYCSLF